MRASRRSSLLVTAAVCGALVLGTAAPTATAEPVAVGTDSTGARVAVRQPAPAALRKAAGEGVKAIDDNIIGKEAAGALERCRPAQAPDAARLEHCSALEGHLGELRRARAGLARQAAAERPDLDAVTTATTDAVAATARLAKERADHEREHEHGHDGGGRGNNGSNGLLGVVTNLVGGLVNTLGGVVGGLGGLVNGLLRALLG
ncbi:hypothetical protein [Streptomyces sp. NPDC053048]|uniref:hypothetical protein n=1 Tax=Streptomyces sp. NPDC053048 TaxID=3365694 RepID=UPI0037D37C12